MVFGGDGEIGATDAAAVQAEPVERLRRRNLVDKVEVDVEKVGIATDASGDYVTVPDLLAEGAGFGHLGLPGANHVVMDAVS